MLCDLKTQRFVCDGDCFGDPKSKAPSSTKTLRRVNFGTGSQFGTDVAKRYGEGSKVIAFLGKMQENGTDT